MKAYIFRHQGGGAVTTHVFLKPPTDAQMEAMNAEADSIFGAGWGSTFEAEVVEDDTVPVFASREPTEPATEFGVVRTKVEFVASGVGQVNNPPGFDPENV